MTTQNLAGLCLGGLLQNDGTMRRGSTNLDNLDGVPLREFFSGLLQTALSGGK